MIGLGAATEARRAWVIWAVGLSAYLVAVFHRSSLAVAGLAATERFGIGASQLATFTMLQLLVYAGMQIPVGLLIERIGPRRVLLTGTVVLSAAQAVFAFAGSYPVALMARALVGVGDAMVFICVLRLANAWFAPRRIPLVTQLTGMLGQVGAVVAAVPMTWALGTLGWTGAYLAAASTGVLLSALLVFVAHDSPAARSQTGPPLSLRRVGDSLTASWAQPGTKLGFWAHFTTQFSSTTMGLLWGYPFLVHGEGRSEASAGMLLTVMVVAAAMAGPTIGWFVARNPWHRSSLVLATVWSIVGAWTLVLSWPGPAPLGLLLVLVVAVGIGVPAAMVGFDFGRTSNPVERQASVTGIINQGGFLASLLLVIAIGVVLDLRTPDSSTAYPPSAFRYAMSCQYVLWAVGLVQLWRYRRRLRAALLAEDAQARRTLLVVGSRSA